MVKIFGLTITRNAPREAIEEVATGYVSQQEPRNAPFSYRRAAATGFLRNEVVRACIMERSESASEARLRLVRRTGSEIEEVERHRMLDVLAEPNPLMDTVEFVSAFIVQSDIGGNVYVLKIPDRVGRTTQLWFLRPDRVKVVPSRTGLPGGFEYMLDGQVYNIPAERVGHFKMFNPLDDWYGAGPLQVLAQQVDLDISATQFARTFFENKAMPGGFLKLKRQVESQEEANEIRRNFHARLTGYGQWNNTGILDADADFKEVTPNMKDMALADLRDLTESRICAALGVPPILVGVTAGLKRATYSNYAQAKESFWEETMLPLYKRIAAFLTRALSAERDMTGLTMDFDFSEVRALQKDEKEQAEREKILADAAGSYLRSGWTPESIKEALNLPEALEHSGFVPVTVYDQGQVDVNVNVDENEADSTSRNIGLPRLAQKALPQRSAPVDALVAVIEAEHDELVDELESVVDAEFSRMLNAAAGMIGSAIDNEEGTRNFGVTGEGLIPPSMDAELAAAMAPVLRALVERVWGDINEADVIGSVSLDSQAPLINSVLNNASSRVKAINDVTRSQINAALQEGINRGYSLRQVADGVDGDNFKGLRQIIRGLPHGPDQQKRARLIARTEIRTAQNQTTAVRYKAAGVSMVEIRDGDEDEACAAVNGTTQSIDWYMNNPVAHPNCTRGATPIVEGLEEIA